jgi:hypothetical protein
MLVRWAAFGVMRGFFASEMETVQASFVDEPASR